jgi:uncharacterized membrane protein HdeD (DUF308 family)
MPWWGVLISGIISLVVGILLLTNTKTTTLVLVQIMAWFWFLGGILNLVMIFFDSRQWGWKLIMGIIGIVAGLWIIKNPIQGAVSTLVAIVIVLGVQALLYGTMLVIAFFGAGGWGSLILGIVSIILGFLLLFNNVLLTSLAVPWVFGIFAIIGGIASIIGSFMQRSQENQLEAAVAAKK